MPHRRNKPRPSLPGRRLSQQQIWETLTSAVRLQQQGQLSKAQTLYRRVLQVEPKNASARSGIGTIALQRGQLHVAVKALTQATRLQPENSGFQMNLAAALERQGEVSKARDGYERAIALDPAYRDPYYNLANLWLKTKDAQRAIEVLDSCLAANGRDFHALAYRVYALLDAGLAEEAAILLDHTTLVHRYKFDAVPGFTDLTTFNNSLASYIASHPSLVKDAMSTVGGYHTGELLGDTQGPLFAFEPTIHRAIHWYIKQLPEKLGDKLSTMPEHPMRQWQPKQWKLTTWGVVLTSGGHERSHIHPNAWLSGVLYLDLPELIQQPSEDHQGWLRFGVPTNELAVRSAPIIHDYQPQYGQIILFPSYFYHGTVPFRSRQQRICVAFDVEPLH